MGPGITLTFQIAYLLISIISMLLNAISTAGIWRERRRIKGIRLYLFSLTAANVFIIVSCAPFTLIEFIEDRWLWSSLTCSIVRGGQFFAVYVCVIIIVVITFER